MKTTEIINNVKFERLFDFDRYMKSLNKKIKGSGTDSTDEDREERSKKFNEFVSNEVTMGELFDYLKNNIIYYNDDGIVKNLSYKKEVSNSVIFKNENNKTEEIKMNKTLMAAGIFITEYIKFNNEFNL
jgi:hypothetical protein